MNEVKLKRCPFCGGEAEIIEAEGNEPETICIQCSSCGVSVHHKWLEPEVLIDYWNRRAERTCHVIPDGCIGRCSACGADVFGDPDGNEGTYCPNCGARVVSAL